ncbi:MAG: cytochrome c1 [Sphingobium sp.]|nr:cytochrome c1 [Sphingobium sp.]
MVRIFGALVGIFFAGMLLVSFVIGLVAVAPVVAEYHSFVAPTVEEEFHKHPEAESWSFNGPFGKYDHKQLQRGFQVYTEVCSACHSLKHVAFRDLEGIGYNEAEVKAIAKNWKAKITDVDPKTGDANERAPTPADLVPVVHYAGQGTPPDLSLIAKARHGGADYIHALLTGYADQAGYKNEKGKELLKEFPDAKTPDGLFFNPYFANLNMAMPPPLTSEGQVSYGPGNPKPTVDQMSQDVSAFLTWAAEPKLEARKSTGFAVVIFLLFASVLSYLSYQSIWANKEH